MENSLITILLKVLLSFSKLVYAYCLYYKNDQTGLGGGTAILIMSV